MDGNDQETKISLPAGFLLGAASSAHQVEGNNMNSDWWHWEQQGRLPKSGDACDHYNRYEEDFTIAHDIGLNAFRISIEWARIEPVEGKWDATAIEHYKKVLKKMKELGLTRMVTLHHFTLPQWLAEQGGFETHKGVQAFARFAWFVAQNLGDEIDLWCTINEPEVYTLMGYIRAVRPPFKKNLFLARNVFNNLARAHNQAYKAIKEVLPNAQIGLAKNNVYYEPYRKNNPLDRMIVLIAKQIGNFSFLNKIKNNLDYIGLNYYFYDRLRLGFFSVKNMNHEFSKQGGVVPKKDDQPRSDMGWRIFPQGIYHLLLDLKKYNKPIYITENGIANARDDMRKDFIKQHLHWITKAIEQGVDARGYFYWSLTDNYELHEGFAIYFGLVEINYQTQERKIRESAKVFKEI